MNRVFQDGTELHNVTVKITNGRAVVTPNAETDSGGGPGEEQRDQRQRNPRPQSGGGPGEERDDKK